MVSVNGLEQPPTMHLELRSHENYYGYSSAPLFGLRSLAVMADRRR